MQKSGIIFLILFIATLSGSEAFLGILLRPYYDYVSLHKNLVALPQPKEVSFGNEDTTVVKAECPGTQKSQWDGTGKVEKYYPADDPSGMSGYITNPDFHGRNQYSGQDCWWHIQAPKGNIIRLTFLDFGLQKSYACSKDYLFITGFTKYCGKMNYRKYDTYGYADSQSPPHVLYSTGNRVSINFHSDHYGSERGFEIRYETVPESEAPAVVDGHFWSWDNSLLDETADLIKSEVGQNRVCNSYGCVLMDWNGNLISNYENN